MTGRVRGGPQSPPPRPSPRARPPGRPPALHPVSGWYDRGVKRRGVLARAVVAAWLLSAPIAVAANAPAALGPQPESGMSAPAKGPWRVVPDQSQPGSSLDQFKGKFTVAGLRVIHLHGTTQHAVNRGCVAGESVTLLGRVQIRHVIPATIPEDLYAVSIGVPPSSVHVRLMLHGRRSRKHRAKKHRVSGLLRIFFPGGTDTIGGYTVYSNLTYSSRPAGICDLRFSITPG